MISDYEMRIRRLEDEAKIIKQQLNQLLNLATQLKQSVGFFRGAAIS